MNMCLFLRICCGCDLQEFISNHTEYYLDKYHGFWIGLSQTDDKNWVWIDGQNDTLRSDILYLQ